MVGLSWRLEVGCFGGTFVFQTGAASDSRARCGGLVGLAEAQDAGAIVRVGAGEEFLRVGSPLPYCRAKSFDLRNAATAFFPEPVFS